MTERRSVDQDGVVRIELPPGARRRWPLGLAALLALAGLGVFMWRSVEPAPGPGGGPRAAGGQRAANATVNGGSTPRSRRAPAAGASPGAGPRPGGGEDPGAAGDPAGEPGSAEDEPGADGEQGAEDPGAGEPGAPERRERAGIPGMPPHGTKLIKEGIVVPEDFELPPGYVRHYQTTDDGRMLDAILMFHPDHRPVDAQGNPVPMPPDRVVPPELAPPGMPVETLKVPDDAYTRPEDDDAPPTAEELGPGGGAPDGEEE